MANRHVIKSKSVEEDFKFELSTQDQKLLDRLEDCLEIDENAIDEELKEQSQLFYEVSKQLTLLVSKRDAAKQYMKEVESRVYLSIKDDAREEELKISEKELEHRCNIHPEYVKQNEILLRLNNAVGQFTALKDAFVQRNYALRDMASLYVANYYIKESINGRDSSRVKEADSSIAKEAMARRRRERSAERD